MRTLLPLLPRRPALLLDRRRRLRRAASTYGYTQAKALVYSAHGDPRAVLSVHTHSIPPAHSKLVTLRTLAAPINPADFNKIEGAYPTAPPGSGSSALGTAQPATVPGDEGVFEVVAAGADAAAAAGGIRPGDWVIPRRAGLGTWRTHLQVDAGDVLRVERAGLAVEQAATVGVNPVTAWRLLTDYVAPPREGDWFIQNGANSAVGRAVLQLGGRRGRGWSNIAVVRDRPDAGDGEPTAAAAARLADELVALGATKVVTESELRAPDFAERVRDWTGGEGRVRLALNCVGGKMATAMCRVVGEGGQVVTYGGMGRRPMPVPAGMLIFRDLTFRGFWLGRWSETHAEERRVTVEALLDLYRRGTLTDSPYARVRWDWGTGRDELVGAVEGTLDGYRLGKGIFIFGDT